VKLVELGTDKWCHVEINQRIGKGPREATQADYITGDGEEIWGALIKQTKLFLWFKILE
jgi:hypothetical protein